eukprot:1317047-Rhodomonas_salina.1
MVLQRGRQWSLSLGTLTEAGDGAGGGRKRHCRHAQKPLMGCGTVLTDLNAVSEPAPKTTTSHSDPAVTQTKTESVPAISESLTVGKKRNRRRGAK